MQSKSAEIQNRLNELDGLIQGEASDVQKTIWENERNGLRDQLQEIANQEQNLALTTEQIGYKVDNITFEGLTLAEIITDDGQFKLVRNGLQELLIFEAEFHDEELRGQREGATKELRIVGDRAVQAEIDNERLKEDIKMLETANFQLALDNESLDVKVRKGAEQSHELTQQLEQKNQHIDELQKQIALGVRGALNVVSEPQDTSKFVADIIASKPRIINVRFKDENGIDTRIKRAENVLTGETFEYEALYERRYIILNAEQAEQYRADEANKKAELELQNTIIPVMTQDIAPVNPVSEEEAPATETPFPSDQVQTSDNGGLQGDQGNEPLHEMVEESEVVTRAEHEALKLNLGAMSDELDSVKKFIGMAA